MDGNDLGVCRLGERAHCGARINRSLDLIVDNARQICSLVFIDGAGLLRQNKESLLQRARGGVLDLNVGRKQRGGVEAAIG
jgi:hypothetical protein